MRGSNRLFPHLLQFSRHTGSAKKRQLLSSEMICKSIPGAVPCGFGIGSLPCGNIAGRDFDQASVYCAAQTSARYVLAKKHVVAKDDRMQSTSPRGSNHPALALDHRRQSHSELVGGFSKGTNVCIEIIADRRVPYRTNPQLTQLLAYPLAVGIKSLAAGQFHRRPK